MTKKIFSLTLGALLLALCFPAKAQQANKVPRIGIYRRAMPRVSPPVPKQFGWLYGSWVT